MLAAALSLILALAVLFFAIKSLGLWVTFFAYPMWWAIHLYLYSDIYLLHLLYLCSTCFFCLFLDKKGVACQQLPHIFWYVFHSRQCSETDVAAGWLELAASLSFELQLRKKRPAAVGEWGYMRSALAGGHVVLARRTACLDILAEVL